MPLSSPVRFGGGRDGTLERIAALNQLLLGVVILVIAVVVVASPPTGGTALFFVGVVIAFFATGVTIVVPWSRFDRRWLALIPLADIVSIAVMRVGLPQSGAGLLWIFPAMWLASTFGLTGAIGGVVAIVVAFILTVIVSPAPASVLSALLLPLTVATVSGASYLTARRAAAQRTLLDKQAQVLSQSLERSRRQEQEIEELLDAADFGLTRIAEDGSLSIASEAPAGLQRALERGTEDGGPRQFQADGVTPLAPDDMPLTRALRGEAFDSQVIWFDGQSPESLALAVSVRRLRGARGTDAGAVLVSRDVTPELQALRARDELVASVSHELRTPLTSILGYLDLAIDDPDLPASARRGLEIAERNAERLLGIVADILAASSTSGRSVELTITPMEVDLADIVRAAVESLQPRADERAIVLDTTGIEPAPAYVDPLRTRQVVDNLIVNAIKYNREGGTVTVGSTTDGEDTSWVLVRDTGMGMSEQEMSGLFERFYRAQGARARGQAGTGLGLSISRDLARAHGGDITVRSTPGAGSTFMLRLPATRAAAAPAPRLPDRPEPGGRSEAGQEARG